MALITRVFNGTDIMYRHAVKIVGESIKKFGEEQAVALPDTAYSLPVIYGFTGRKITNLAEMEEMLGILKNEWMTRNKRVDDVFSNGLATAMCAEIIETINYLYSDEPYRTPYQGHFTDAQIRELGLPLVTDEIPGVAVIIGEAPSAKEGVALIKKYQSQGIFTTVQGGIVKQAHEAGLQMGFDRRISALGVLTSSVVHVVSVAVRAALIFGAIEPGNTRAICEYTMKRVHAFVNAFEPVNDVVVACGAGAIAMGFPVITNDDHKTWRIPKSLIIQPDTKKFNETSIEARDITIKVAEMDIPVSYAAAFEGEIVRRGDMQVEIDGSRHDCFELVQTKELSEIEDHAIILDGPDIKDIEVGGQMCLGTIVEVAGKNMQSDFEPVFERKIHNYLNCLEGVMHTGQRDMIRIRVNKSAFEQGFSIKHFGEVLYCMIMNDFGKVVNKCQVRLVTDPAKTKELRASLANAAYDKRDERLLSLTDEKADVFYSCILCQSFSPSHVCVITPERLGLCGAVSWLDAKATNELDKNGPCQVITKGGLQDENIGKWDDVDAAVQKFSQGALESVSLYSIMQDPMTSCGCFECICGMEFTSNGVVIVNREYSGMTPLGMSFSEMASMTGGGVQTPGFMGHGKHYIASKKYMKAEGGIARIVWMPKELKDTVASKLNATAKELYGIDNYTDMIADETVTQDDPSVLYEYLAEKGHPALELPSWEEFM